MKPATLLFAAVAVLLAVSTTAWPFWWPPHIPDPYHHPYPVFPPHRPTFPFPPHGGSAPAPSSGGPAPHLPSLPPVADMTKCMQAVHDSSAMACSPFGYDAGKCCSHLTGMGDACSYLPYFQSALFQGIVKHVCDGGSGSSPSPPSS